MHTDDWSKKKSGQRNAQSVWGPGFHPQHWEKKVRCGVCVCVCEPGLTFITVTVLKGRVLNITLGGLRYDLISHPPGKLHSNQTQLLKELALLCSHAKSDETADVCLNCPLWRPCVLRVWSLLLGPIGLIHCGCKIIGRKGCILFLISHHAIFPAAEPIL